MKEATGMRLSQIAVISMLVICCVGQGAQQAKAADAAGYLQLEGGERINVAPMIVRYSWLSERLADIQSQSAQLMAAPDEAAAAAGAETAQTLSLLTDAETITQAQWQEIQKRFQPLQDAAYEAQAKLSFARISAADTPVAVGAVGAMTKVFRHIWPENATSHLELSCARNERESGQVLIAALERDLTGVEVTVDPLIGPATLEDAVEPGLICYVRTTDTRLLTHHVGLWPDGISPVAPFDLPQGQVQPIWLTVAIPTDVPAGRYATAVHISADGLPRRSVPVIVTVWDFTLPDKISLPNVFGLSRDLVENWYRDKGLTWEQLRGDYYRFWLEHRLNPTSLYRTIHPSIEELDEALDGGANTFVTTYVYPGETDEEQFMQETLEELAQWDRLLAQRDLYDSAIVYLADEPKAEQPVIEQVNRRASMIAERFPKMRQMLTLTRPIDPAFEDSADIWCILTSRMRLEDMPQVRERGQEYWWYAINQLFDIDMPAVSARTMPWLTFKHDLDGILYWLMQSRWRGRNTPDRFSPVPGDTIWEEFSVVGRTIRNGRGNMVYPGHDGRPWSSQRLEILREGMEDYEYLLLLRDAIERNPASPHSALLEVPEQLSLSYPWGTDADFMTDWRDAIGTALHELQ